MQRREPLVTGEIYHIYNRSIAGFKIFNNKDEFTRMQHALRYYRVLNISPKLSEFLKLEPVKISGFVKHYSFVSQGKTNKVQIIAYCLMPTHIHLILKQLHSNGISTFISDILNSYSRYFNRKHQRSGPLWEGRFKDVLVKTDESLLHLTRYVHLNPVTDRLVNNPEEWSASSYKEYLMETQKDENICDYKNILEIKASDYRLFTENRIAYQRELSRIKKIAHEPIRVYPNSTYGVEFGHD